MSAPNLAADALESLSPAYTSLDNPGSVAAAFAASVLAPLQRVADVVLDDGGAFNSIFDGTISDPAPLAWGAQWAGVDPTTLTETQLRDAATLRRRWYRGTLPSVTGAIRSVLTGSKHLRLYERRNPADFTVDAPYHLTIVTNTAETPGGSASIIAALNGVIPKGTALHISIVTGQSWQDLVDSGASWSTVLSTFTNWRTVYTG